MFALVTLLTCCSVGDIRRAPPSPGPPSHTGPPPSPPAADLVGEIRTTRLAVPSRYDLPYVEFVDAENGYVLFAACDGQPPGPDCPALLWSTRDGGRSWQRVAHPQPVADEQQLFAVPGMLALSTAPHGWWTSTDHGESFQHSPGATAPARWQAAEAPFQLIERTGKVGRWSGRSLRPVPTQPPLSVIHSVAVGQRLDQVGDRVEFHGPLMAAGFSANGRPSVAISSDEGQRWRSMEVPAAAGEVGVLRGLVGSGELWLIGERPDRTSFPELWRYHDLSGWSRVSAVGHPETARVVPMGGNTVAVIGPRGGGAVIGGTYLDLSWPVTAEHSLRLLPDGTLFAALPGAVLLGFGHYAQRSWVAVNVTGA
ncbi:hypothetical protein D2L64_10935 [Micromonospora radicis]|uniref:Exo-alpha-sialidase n=1 Tax=Micromonospora radicis TaxID=1894971 RepID=A0A418MW73_9ACTN|nr:hypothetical protein D2L64_10935 [Micromonospora radicis]